MAALRSASIRNTSAATVDTTVHSSAAKFIDNTIITESATLSSSFSACGVSPAAPSLSATPSSANSSGRKGRRRATSGSSALSGDTIMSPTSSPLQFVSHSRLARPISTTDEASDERSTISRSRGGSSAALHDAASPLSMTSSMGADVKRRVESVLLTPTPEKYGVSIPGRRPPPLAEEKESDIQEEIAELCAQKDENAPPVIAVPGCANRPMPMDSLGGPEDTENIKAPCDGGDAESKLHKVGSEFATAFSALGGNTATATQHAPSKASGAGPRASGRALSPPRTGIEGSRGSRTPHSNRRPKTHSKDFGSTTPSSSSHLMTPSSQRGKPASERYPYTPGGQAVTSSLGFLTPSFIRMMPRFPDAHSDTAHAIHSIHAPMAHGPMYPLNEPAWGMYTPYQAAFTWRPIPECASTEGYAAYAQHLQHAHFDALEPEMMHSGHFEADQHTPVLEAPPMHAGQAMPGSQPWGWVMPAPTFTLVPTPWMYPGMQSGPQYLPMVPLQQGIALAGAPQEHIESAATDSASATPTFTAPTAPKPLNSNAQPFISTRASTSDAERSFTEVKPQKPAAKAKPKAQAPKLRTATSDTLHADMDRWKTLASKDKRVAFEAMKDYILTDVARARQLTCTFWQLLLEVGKDADGCSAAAVASQFIHFDETVESLKTFTSVLHGLRDGTDFDRLAAYVNRMCASAKSMKVTSAYNDVVMYGFQELLNHEQFDAFKQLIESWRQVAPSQLHRVLQLLATRVPLDHSCMRTASLRLMEPARAYAPLQSLLLRAATRAALVDSYQLAASAMACDIAPGTLGVLSGDDFLYLLLKQPNITLPSSCHMTLVNAVQQFCGLVRGAFDAFPAGEGEAWCWSHIDGVTFLANVSSLLSRSACLAPELVPFAHNVARWLSTEMLHRADKAIESTNAKHKWKVALNVARCLAISEKALQDVSIPIDFPAARYLLQSLQSAEIRYVPIVLMEYGKYYELKGMHSEADGFYTATAAFMLDHTTDLPQIPASLAAVIKAKPFEENKRATQQYWKLWVALLRTKLVHGGDIGSLRAIAEMALKSNGTIGSLWATLAQLQLHFSEPILPAIILQESVLRLKDRLPEDSCSLTPTIHALTLVSHGLKEVERSGELWVEYARLLSQPDSVIFDLSHAQECLKEAIQLTPQNGDTHIESMRLCMLQYLVSNPKASVEELAALGQEEVNSRLHDSEPTFGPAYLAMRCWAVECGWETAREALDHIRRRQAQMISSHRAAFLARVNKPTDTDLKDAPTFTNPRFDWFFEASPHKALDHGASLVSYLYSMDSLSMKK